MQGVSLWVAFTVPCQETGQEPPCSAMCCSRGRSNHTRAPGTQTLLALATWVATPGGLGKVKKVDTDSWL